MYGVYALRKMHQKEVHSQFYVPVSSGRDAKKVYGVESKHIKEVVMKKMMSSYNHFSLTVQFPASELTMMYLVNIRF
jgi:hypothetical protein